MSELLDAVRAGRTAEVVSLLDGMTDTERRVVFPELKALRKELRPNRWSPEANRAHPALHAAGAACQTGAAGVASWLVASDMRWSQASPGLLLHLLGDRDPDWLADVAHRLAQRPTGTNVPYELMAGLVQLAGCPAPTTEAYVQGWVWHIGRTWRQGDVLVDRLRKEVHLPVLVAALFETDEVGSSLWWLGKEGPNSWTGALAQLADEGVLERQALLDACVARLLRGGPTAGLRVCLRLLNDLSLSRAEERERTADWLALTSDAISVVASHAQSVLSALALEGELLPRRLAEMSEAVLFRTEKKLVRAQLVLLGKVLVRDPATADELLPGAAQAFGHPDPDVQERALKLVERHAGKAGTDAVRKELAVSAEQLIPVLRARAVGTLGAASMPAETLPYEEVLPPAPEPTRVAPGPRSTAELVEEISALVAAEQDVSAFERTLDGLVRHAYDDQEALVEALDPVLRRYWWYVPDPASSRRADDHFGRPHGLAGGSDALELLLATLSGKVLTSTLHSLLRRRATSSACAHAPLALAFDSRIEEIAHRTRTDPLPFLLSTPSWSTGLLEPDELVDRLDGYRDLGARPSEADFAQALLRVRRGARSAATAAADRAAALGTAEGTRLARWLTAERPAPATGRRRTAGSRILLELGELEEFQGDFPEDVRQLGRPVTVSGARWYCGHWSDEVRRHWLAMLPEHRELVAARLLHDLSTVAVDEARGVAAVLPLLAESGGEAGEAVHLCLAYGLGARYPEDRLAAVDALLVLAARGQLDADRLGADLGQLVRRGAVKATRLAESVRAAAATGAEATVWRILRHTLPILLADLATGGTVGGGNPASRGLGELLGAAAECAERSGARGELPHLARAADRRGSSRLVTQARRLRGALNEEVAA
ncbi:DUF6493 family protein [Streptomyces sp. SID13726]|uniref:DUF7824 domain-containing protein n=1 Tax=Streptomyces sp. SID13726 TaxID=2706058 RepID=UPI0013B6B675|nr:DUF6493 family protein [Streptomyces sp. SID13726]NEB01152.1 hypothetical protein [Streptomyces sp. SID13726]